MNIVEKILKPWAVADAHQLEWKVAFVSGTEIEGIIINIDQPTAPLSVSIYINGVFFCTQLACLLVDCRHFQFMGEEKYERLVKNLKGNQIIAARFSYIVPDYAVGGPAASVVIKETQSGTEILSQSRTFREDFHATKKRLFGLCLTGQLYVADLREGHIHFGGNFRAMTGNEDISATSTHDQIVEARASLISEEEGIKTIKLEGVSKLSGLEDVIRVVDNTQERAVPLSAGVYVPADCVNEYKNWRIPSDASMRRVMGFSNALAYYFGGFANYKMLDNALKEFAGRSISEFDTMLDWGCGCGRVTQHLMRRTSAKVCGIDIDAENVAWCSKNFSDGTFVACPLMPPTSLASESVDLIVGISVFTHLDEIAQDAWLQELRRLLRPGGIALLTILSEHSFCELPDLGKWTIPPSLYREFRIKGISDSTIGNTLNDVVGLKNFSYYRETWHSHEYVKTKWGSVMRVIGIKRAAHFNYQDIVVLTKDPQWEALQPVSSWCESEVVDKRRA